MNRFRKFGSLITLVRSIAHLKQFIKSFEAKREMTHLSKPKKLNPQILGEAESFIVKETQRNFYLEDIDALQRKCQINKNSNLVQLNPFLDSDGTLRVGGHLKNSDRDKSHHLTWTVSPGQINNPLMPWKGIPSGEAHNRRRCSIKWLRDYRM